MDDPDLYVRVYAIQLLRDLNDERAVERLCKLLLEQSSEPLMVSDITIALGAIHSTKAIPTLTDFLENNRSFSRYEAAFALGEIGDESRVPALERLLSDETIPKEGSKSTIYTVGELAQRAIDKIRPNGN